MKAQNYMEKACSKEPYLERAYYNYAIMLQQQQKYKESLQLLKTALIKGGNNQEGIHYMKLLAEINLNLKSEAVKSARKLVDISNNNPRYVSILKSLNE